MEKEENCPTSFNIEIPYGQFTNCYFQTNWENPIDQNDPFESALSSMVSSPTATSNGGGLISGDGMMRELIGRLGSISDSGEISCIATANNSTNNSCYSTPLNSPPKKSNLSSSIMMKNGNFPNYPPNFPPLNADPGFVERAAKYSCLGSGNFCGGDLGINKRSILGLENGEMGDSREGSSLSEQNPGGEIGFKSQNCVNSRKRKSISKLKHDKVEEKHEKGNAKKSKGNNEECSKQNVGETNNNTDKKDKENNSNNKEAAKPDPPKDYIHVRARRGQATDSHSLAERVRREKISERMKFLQDLVPGCNKVTGKATVLDEIINYVQSLQRQVEFLSMKLSTFNPRMEFNAESLHKDMFQSRGSAIPQLMYQLEQNSAQIFPLNYNSIQQLSSPLANGTENPFSLNPLNAAGIRRNPLPSLAGFGDQMPNFWEDDLQSIVQMGIVQNQAESNLHGNTLPNAQMKAEL